MTSSQENFPSVKEEAKEKKHVAWKRNSVTDSTTLLNAFSKDSGHSDVFYEDDDNLEKNELYAQDQSSSAKPWWKTNFFISEPILFGTWDGVFTSCMINLFGVIVFLRSGWMVAQAGIWYSLLVICLAVLIVLASVFSGIGICERCVVDRGGVFYLLSHVLGAKIGGSVGILYCFGQAVSAALHSIGFGESIGKLLQVDDVWIERSIAISLLFVIILINIAGVIWVIKLQFILLLILLLAALDFGVGSFIQTNPGAKVDGYYSYNFWNNSYPNYTEDNNLFTIFGVFFPSLTGVFAGINMSGDLRDPAKDIPTGTLSAISTCSFLYVIFILILGATCQREALLNNYLIAEQVSALGVLFLSGLYVSSVSACLATLYGTPRILQSIALENVIPFIRFLGQGKGPNKIPIVGILLIASITLIFLLIGEINTLAPIVTIPFLLTYMVINYAYFSLAMTAELWKKRDLKFSPTFDTPSKNTYGSVQNGVDFDKQLFPKHKFIQKQKDSCTSSLISSPDEHSSIQSTDGHISEWEINSQDNESSESITDFTHLLSKGNKDFQQKVIKEKSKNWYSPFCSRWISLLGVISNFLLMFFVQWLYAILHIIIWIALYVYISQANPGISPGIAEFKFFPWLKMILLRLIGRSSNKDQIIITPMHPGIEVMSSQLTEENEDFASRERYHQSSKFNHFGEE